MSSIVIAEKPDQARLYRDAIGNRYGQVLAARGHLFELAEPEDVNPAWKDWTVGILRPDTGFYPPKIKNDADAKKRYKAIKDAARKADTIYVATDPDREGEGIGTTIVNMLRREIKWDGRVMRVLPLAQDKDSLSKAFSDAQPGDNFRALFQSFVARQQGDQIYNLSLTRSASKLFKPPGWKGALSVGRVLTPTLGLVCRREREIANFVPEDYFNPWVDVAGEAGRVRLTHAPNEQNRLFERPAAQRIAESAASYAGPISVKLERKKQAPPVLFSLAKLQAEAARRFKWSVKKTTDVLQAIYEAQAVTYPRSSEVSLPESEIENAPAMMGGILGLPFTGNISWGQGEPIIRVKKGAFSDKDLKGAAHFAIVPNINTVESWGSLYGKMSADQQRLFELIARRYLAAIGPDRVYDSTRQWITVENRDFVATGTVEIEPGWKEAAGKAPAKESDDEDGGALPAFKHGDAVKADGVGLAEKQTIAPPRYTDATLIIAMIEAWKHVDDPELRTILKETEGIGTEATRSSIVSNMLKRGLIGTMEKKSGALQATAAGMEFFDILEKAAPKLLDVGLTGQMEMMLEQIKAGEQKAAPVVEQIVGVATSAVDSMVAAKEAGASISSSQSRPPSEGMKRAARAKAKREGKRVPAGVLSDMAKCREYLGPMPDRGAGGGAPSEKALSFAQKIAGEKGIEIPETALSDGKALSKWIDTNKGGSSKGGSGSRGRSNNGRAGGAATSDGRPSSKQVGFAEKIAGRKQIDVPPECYQDRGAMSRWIDANKA